MVERLTVMHVISGLNVGGAEQMLYRLVKHHSQLGNKCIVVSLGSSGDFGGQITESGVELHALGMTREPLGEDRGQKVPKLARFQ